jgi:hypothetical protein
MGGFDSMIGMLIILTKIKVNFGQNDRHSDHQVSQIRPYACILISNSLIVQFLNKKIYGIELKQCEEKQEEYLTFSNAQRDNGIMTLNRN